MGQQAGPSWGSITGPKRRRHASPKNRATDRSNGSAQVYSAKTDGGTVKIDQEYLKKILDTFTDSPRSFVWVGDLLDKGLNMDDKFLFHIQILEDQKFIESLDKKNDIGYRVTLGGEYTWESHPLRLTAAGHEFAEAMNKAEIWEILSGEFRDASLSTLKDVATSLLKGFAKKQLGKYIEV